MSSRKDAFRRYLTSRARNRVIVASRWFTSFACGLVLIGAPPAYSQENVVVATDAVSQNEQNTQESQPKPSPTPEPTTQSLNIGGLTFSGSLRGRAENWSWFEAPRGQSDYTFGALLLRLCVSQKREKFDWLIEGLSPWLINLPTQAILPAPQGQLGLGATYYAANHNQDGSAVFRQGYVRFKGIFGDLQSSFQ